MDRNTVQEAKLEARIALRQADRAIWGLGVLAQELFDELDLLMGSGPPSHERKAEIHLVYESFHAKLKAYEAAMRKVSTGVKDFCSENKNIDPAYLALLKMVVDTCNSVIEKTESAALLKENTDGRV